MADRPCSAAIVAYEDGPDRRKFTGLRADLIALFLAHEQGDWTLLELATRLNDLGIPVNDSTVSARLHELRDLGLVVDDLPDRPCRKNRRIKKVWRLGCDAGQRVRVIARFGISEADGNAGSEAVRS